MTATTSSVDISEIGLTVLAEGGSNPVVDIVPQSPCLESVSETRRLVSWLLYGHC
jgi:hypothetical protein